MSAAVNVAEQLNAQCFCRTLDREAVAAAFARESEQPELGILLRDERRHLFSNVSVFVTDDMFDRMAGAVRAIGSVAALPQYRDHVLRWAPPIAHRDHGPAGTFMGYDFHLGDDGPKLIEINTNAGGAFINAVLARAQSACCGMEAALRKGFPDTAFDQSVVRTFEEEWRLQRGSGRPAGIAIVDDRPEDQYLYPEFVLAKKLLERHGFEAVIADPQQLTHTGDRLLVANRPVDLVYNRLVDFSLAEPRHRALRDAYASGHVVLTPNPHVHASLADKRNLSFLSDPACLEAAGASPSDIALLTQVVPETIVVTPQNADGLWRARKQFFFKPATGHGSKAAYRGAKLTRKVWAQIASGTYVAQRYAQPSARMIEIDGVTEARKVDVRLYAYRGEILLTAARLYKGQATNFRTEGGGFAPVLRTSTLEKCPA